MENIKEIFENELGRCLDFFNIDSKGYITLEEVSRDKTRDSSLEVRYIVTIKDIPHIQKEISVLIIYWGEDLSNPITVNLYDPDRKEDEYEFDFQGVSTIMMFHLSGLLAKEGYVMWFPSLSSESQSPSNSSGNCNSLLYE